MSIRKLGHTFFTNFIGDNTTEGKRAPKYNYESEEKMRSEATKFSTRTEAKPR